MKNRRDGNISNKDILQKYTDKYGKEFVILTNKDGVSEIIYVRDLIIATFGNADEYDKIMEEK